MTDTPKPTEEELPVEAPAEPVEDKALVPQQSPGSPQVEGVENIDGEPTILLAEALTILARIRGIFPSFHDLQIPYKSELEETDLQASILFDCELKKRLGIDPNKEISALTEDELKRFEELEGDRIDSGAFYYEGFLSPDELRKKYPEGSLERVELELILKHVRVRVKEAFEMLYNRLCIPPIFGPEESAESLNDLKQKFAAAMTSIGVEYDPIRMGVWIPDGQGGVAEVREIVTSMGDTVGDTAFKTFLALGAEQELLEEPTMQLDKYHRPQLDEETCKNFHDLDAKSFRQALQASPTLLQASLSEKVTLPVVEQAVAVIQEQIENALEHDAIQSLSHFERARVFVVLGREEEAKSQFDLAIKLSEDPIEIGAAYNAIGELCFYDSPQQAELYFDWAIGQGYLEAYANWGFFLIEHGKKKEGIAKLFEGFDKGVGLCLADLLAREEHENDLTMDDIWEAMSKKGLKADHIREATKFVEQRLNRPRIDNGNKRIAPLRMA
jgi:tetratricopeptide (TPR) repeat protein